MKQRHKHSNMPKRLKKIGCVFFVASMGFSCSDMEPVKKKEEKKEEISPENQKKPQALRETQQKTQKHYIGIGKRDPFRSYLTSLNQDDDKTDENRGGRIKAVTEQFRLEQYRLTALITGTSRPHAMVEDPSGSGHILRIGSRLGKNGGRVTRITGQGVTVTLETSVSGNKKVRVKKTLTLPKADFDLVGQNDKKSTYK